MKDFGKAGWKAAPLGAVAQIRPNKKEAKSILSDEDEVSFVPMDCLKVDQVALAEHKARPLGRVYGGYTYFRDGDVLLAKITPCFENGKLGIANDLTNGVGFGSSEFFVLRPSEELLAGYLYHFLNRQSFRYWAKGRMTGAVGHKRVPKELVETLVIPLPPLEEQQRIVAVLDEAFEGLARARAHVEANLHNARELFDNFTTGVFSQIIEEHGQTTLEDICEFIKDGTHQTPKYFDSGFLFLSAKNIKGGRLDWEDVKYIDEAQHIAMQKRLSPRLDDLLIRKNGAGYGAAALVDRDVIFDVYVSVAVLRPKEGILPEYLLQFANSSFAQSQFKDRIKGQGVPNLHLQEIKQVKLPVPKDVAVQNEIAERIQSALEAVRVVESNYQKKLQDVDDLRQSLLQKAFAGELT